MPNAKKRNRLVGPHVFVCHVAHHFLNFSAAIKGSAVFSTVYIFYFSPVSPIAVPKESGEGGERRCSG